MLLLHFILLKLDVLCTTCWFCEFASALWCAFVNWNDFDSNPCAFNPIIRFSTCTKFVSDETNIKYTIIYLFSVRMGGGKQERKYLLLNKIIDFKHPLLLCHFRFHSFKTIHSLYVGIVYVCFHSVLLRALCERLNPKKS